MIPCSRCGHPVEPMQYYVGIQGIPDEINVQLVSITNDNEERDFCRLCRILIMSKMIEILSDKLIRQTGQTIFYKDK